MSSRFGSGQSGARRGRDRQPRRKDRPSSGRRSPGVGLTAAELTQRLTDEYAKKVKSPVVTVSLREVNSYRFYFVGKVAKPGMYASRSEVTLLQAISIAGGILDGADLAQAYVARGKDRVPWILSASCAKGT